MAITGWDMQDMTWEDMQGGLVRCRNPLASGIGTDRERALADWKLGAQRGKDEQLRFMLWAMRNSNHPNAAYSNRPDYNSANPMSHTYRETGGMARNGLFGFQLM